MRKSHKEILIYWTKQENKLKTGNKRGKGAYHGWKHPWQPLIDEERVEEARVWEREKERGG